MTKTVFSAQGHLGSTKRRYFKGGHSSARGKNWLLGKAWPATKPRGRPKKQAAFGEKTRYNRGGSNHKRTEREATAHLRGMRQKTPGRRCRAPDRKQLVWCARNQEFL